MEELTGTQNKLREMAEAITLLDAAGEHLCAQRLEPGEAAYFAWLTERATQSLARLQIQAADALQHSGSHQLDTASLDAIAQAGTEPSLAQLKNLQGTCARGRSTFRDAADLHSGWLGIPHGAARARLDAAGSLIATMTESGARTAANCPQLATEFTDLKGDPRPLISAARAIRKATADLQSGAARQQLESQAVELIKQEAAPSAAKHLASLIADQVQSQRPAAALFADAGLFPRGMQRGLMVYLLKVFPHEAELIESLRAKTDNPNTIAGNRAALNEHTRANFSSAHHPVAEGSAPTGPAQAAPHVKKEWDDLASMPAWAQPEHTPLTPSTDAPAPASTPAPPADAEQAQADPTLPVFEDLSPALRHLSALITVLRSNHLGSKQTGPQLVSPQVIVHLNYEKMLAGAQSFATTENGMPLTGAAARTLMCQAGIYPVVLDGKSRPLDIGRAKRLFPPHMKRALAARDRGCIYPDCAMSASRCEADHIDPWEEGGETRVDRGVLLCPMHHHARHAGLFSLVVNDGAPPAVLLPKFLDPDQQPRRNTYWFAATELLAS